MQNEPTSTSAKPALNRAPSSAENQEIFMIPRQKSRSKQRRESRMFIVDGQLCWADSDQTGSFGGLGSKRNSSMGLLFGSSIDLSGLGHSIDSSGGAGSGSDEAISYRINRCRENIIQLKRQTWPMEKKLQVLKASKLFIKQHQGELKQSKQAKDVIAGSSVIFERYWRHFKREFANFLVIITPWEMRIKKIESHFGSVVASYFTFLRWIFWLNLANSLVMVAFVMVPELIENSPDLTGMRKGDLGMQQPIGADGKLVARPEFNPTLGEIWEFEGFLKFSPIFYGYYSNVEINPSGFWRNPLAYLLSAMLSYLFCFFCISRKLSQNTKMSRTGSKDDEYTFCWTVFVGWDFMIGNSETAYNKTSSLVMNLKEGILEEKEQNKDRDWRLIMRRVLANLLTFLLIMFSAYVVNLAVQRSENLPDEASLYQKNELTLVMGVIQFIFPPIFDVIGIIEKYHPRKALSWQLGRILSLDFLNFYTLMFSLFGTVHRMGTELNEVSGNITLFRKNATYWSNLFATITTTTLAPETTTTSSLASLNDSSSSSNSNSSNSSYFGDTTTTTTKPTSTWLSDVPLTLEQPPPSAGGGVNLNASTILTSVLLASSTVMPSSNTADGGESMLTTTSSTTESFIQATTLGSFFGSPVTGTTTTNLDAMFYKTVEPTREFSTKVGSFAELSSTTTAASNTSSQPTRATNINEQDTDQDYPDLNEVLGKRGSVRLVKRAASGRGRPRGRIRKAHVLAVSSIHKQQDGSVSDVVKFDQTEREYDLGSQSEELIRQTSTSSPPPPRFHGAYIPTIRDPYRKVGVLNNNGPLEPTLTPSDEEQENEEPLEGRLEQSVHRAPPTTKRPQAHGMARPIGGGAQRGSRVQMTKPPRLDDDANEDTLEPTEEGLSDGQDSPSRTTTAGYPVATGDSISIEAERPQPTEKGFTESTTTGFGADSPGPATPDEYPNQSQGSYPGLSSNSPSSVNGSESEGATLLPTNNSSTPDNDNEKSVPQAKSALAPQTVARGDTKWATQEPLEGSNGTISSVTGGAATSCALPIESSTELRYPNGTSLGSHLNSGVGFNASEISFSNCVEIPNFEHQEILALNDTFRDKLKSLCWETMFGQEMVKIVVMDLVMTVGSVIVVEFLRGGCARYCNRMWCWNLERGFPGYADFKIAENVLHLVNNQSNVWMGMFFAPGLPAINTVKLAIMMYVRSWAVLTCNIPHETVFKVNKSNNFYYWILLINLLICILPVAYATTWIRPSWHCGPFGGECRMYLVMTKLVKSVLPTEANSVLRYIASPGAVIPILISLILIIYYLASTLGSSKEANKELKAQLKKDKEQEGAVPEITNTTVADPPAAAAAAPTTPAATGAPAPSASGTTTAVQPAELNPNNLAPSLGPTMAEGAPVQPSGSRPKPAKSLLMPPPS